MQPLSESSNKQKLITRKMNNIREKVSLSSKNSLIKCSGFCHLWDSIALTWWWTRVNYPCISGELLCCLNGGLHSWEIDRRNIFTTYYCPSYCFLIPYTSVSYIQGPSVHSHIIEACLPYMCLKKEGQALTEQKHLCLFIRNSELCWTIRIFSPKQSVQTSEMHIFFSDCPPKEWVALIINSFI